MAKLYFYYSSMNAGKSALLLICNHNYVSNNMHTIIMTPSLDSRNGIAKVSSRIGLESAAIMFNQSDNLYDIIIKSNNNSKINCVFIDESQFMTSDQVDQVSDICDNLYIPVIAYGLRTDSNGSLFEGSGRLLAVADKLIEVKTMCNAQVCGHYCDKKATMVIRLDENGQPIKNGEQIFIGDHEYISVCRKHYKAIHNFK